MMDGMTDDIPAAGTMTLGLSFTLTDDEVSALTDVTAAP